MGWVGNKWFPRWRGDTCSGWYYPPADGSKPIWELKIPDWEGVVAAGENLRPRWVMINGREISHNEVGRTAGESDCEIIPLDNSNPKKSPEGWGSGIPFSSHYCMTHMIFLYGEDGAGVLEHFGSNKGAYGNWRKAEDARLKTLGIVVKKEEKIETPKPKIDVPENIAAELRAFLEPIVAANEKFVGLWKQGKIGPLVGAAMRENKGKYEGKFIEAMLKEIVGV